MLSENFTDRYKCTVPTVTHCTPNVYKGDSLLFPAYLLFKAIRDITYI